MISVSMVLATNEQPREIANFAGLIGFTTDHFGVVFVIEPILEVGDNCHFVSP